MPKPPIEELDYGMTPLGELILRRRQVASLDGVEVFEVKLDGQFLMSSLVNAAEIALATIALESADRAQCERAERDVLVGGLGLGYTAQAALDAPDVRSVTVIEYLARVVGWHQRGLVPLASRLVNNPRCRLIQGDFFEVFDSAALGFSSEDEADTAAGALCYPERFHAILVDIDHSPQCLLQPSHAAFYTAGGIKRVANRLHAGGVFALWSAERPEGTFLSAAETRSAAGYRT
ncbi:MAG TPA: spermidine synthase [Phycisphaerae bacterium]|nr:spermidine synthase [Phycisphaerae bacterium]